MKKLLLFTLLCCIGVSLHAQKKPRRSWQKNKSSKVERKMKQRRSVLSKYDKAGLFSNGLAAVSLAEKWGYADSTGTLVIATQYDSADRFRTGQGLVSKDGKYWLINAKGEATTLKYDTLYFTEPYYVYRQDGKYGLLNESAKMIVEPQFEKVDKVYNNQLPVKKDGQWGIWENGTVNFEAKNLVLHQPEEIPFFSTECYMMKDRAEAKKCSQKAMLMATYRNIRYPAIARENSVQGTVVVQFIIEKDGQVKDAKVVRDIGAGCGAESLRVVVEHLSRWARPGYDGGLPVRTIYTMPVRFRLE